MWITGGMTITGKNQSTGRKPCPSVNFCTANPTLTRLISSGPPGERAMFNQVSHGTVR